MAQTFKVYIPLLVIAALSVFGLFAPVIYSDVYGEILNESPTLYMPMVQAETATMELCTDPRILHYSICIKELTSVA